ncbi:MAG: PNGase F N-terminal domain-containing protein [Flavobacterium sp.]|uniref:PNGase F N-terminal domain-containing protein n=1 Tax=Flavobacterium sp. TaxID=239 RepID=UPI002606ED58|nr:PNGase F N-terminal domain-containing protein [Flavobacterium sp.]MDD5149206.1 PNGase F N-terminal domain-containing protein [Flavobacterium sp.]
MFPFVLIAQNKFDVYKVSYDQYENEKKINRSTEIFFQNQIVFLTKNSDKMQQYIDLKNNVNISTIAFEDKIFKKIIPFDSLPSSKKEDDTRVILGYNCEHVSFSYFSNRIDIWYTEKAIAKGTPNSNYLPNKNALVLKMVYNGNQTLVANAITKVKNYQPFVNYNDGAIVVDKSEFEEIIINSRYKKLAIFDNEIINFDPNRTIPKENELVTDKVYHFSNGSVVLKKIKITPELKNSQAIFAKLTCKSNGDAYDRTGSVFIAPTKKKDDITTLLDAYLYGLDRLPIYIDNKENKYQGIIKEEGYSPAIEILSFFTPFGVNYFNNKRKINNYNWAKEVIYKEEVSSLIPTDEDEVWIGIFIGNYDAGGHIVSLELDAYPSMDKKEGEVDRKKYIAPLFSTVNTMEMSEQNYGGLFANDTLKVNFEIKEDIQNLQLLYTTTGHGGWDNGDEFVPRMNKIFVDGEEVFKIIPWRTDCATYRLSNPASGNFYDGLSSSDLSRSNWCPGTLTPPYSIPLSKLQKGKHVIEVVIEQGPNEGSSTNHWNISGVLVGQLNNLNLK